MKQKILVVHNYYKLPGGEDTVFHNEVEMLKKNGHKVYTYTRSNFEIDSMNIFQKICIPFTSLFSIKTYRDIKRIIRKKKIDIVHVHNTLSLISPSVYYAAVSMNVPVVQTLHNFRMICPGATLYRDGKICEECIKKGIHCSLKHKCYRNSYAQTAISALILKIHRMSGIYKKINYICLTEFNKKKLLEANNTQKIVDSNKIYVKPNFTSTLDVSHIDITKYGIKRKAYYLYAARLEDIKGIKVAVKAFEKSGLPLVVVGTGNQEDIIKKYIKKKRINNIIMLGYVEREECLALMHNAKAVVVCSQWYETFGMTVIEAYSQGVPVIAGDIGNMGNIVEENLTGYKYIYNDYMSLYTVVNNFEEISEIEKLKFSSKEKYVKYYSEQNNYIQLMKVYDGC